MNHSCSVWSPHPERAEPRARAKFVSLACLAVVALIAAGHLGCANGRAELDTGRRPTDARGVDAFEGECDPPCSEGFVCVGGECQVGGDADGDGISRDFDCDDRDPTVRDMAERTCAGPCGSGVERCVDGQWGECSAPSTCDCEPGAMPRMISCAMCGTQRQICVGGRWVDDGVCMSGSCAPGAVEMGAPCGNCGVQARTCRADCTWGPWVCSEEGVCARGTMETETENCGLCGTGTRRRVRVCGADCRWQPFGEWSACAGDSSECMPGAMETETQPCGHCDLGRRTRSRTCDPATCRWSAWSDYGPCVGGGACAPGATRPCPNGDSCGVERCSASCTWGACEPRDPGGCLRIRPGTTGPEGNNYRCCRLTPTDDGWQFCLPTCRWSTACEATTAC